MIRELFNIIAPDHCYGCHQSGRVLCDNCKYDIESEPFSACLMCGVVSPAGTVCSSHRLHYSQGWCVGERHDTLEMLIDAYKFGRNSRAAITVGELLVTPMAKLPLDTMIVPIPTITKHIRQRGYDHTKLIARQIAKRTNLEVVDLLKRRNNSVQRQMSRQVRLKQAAEAFKLDETIKIDPERVYVVVDDVFTTGATVEAAAKLLHDAGAVNICVAVAARQPIDDKR